MNSFTSLLQGSTEYEQTKKALELGRTPVCVTGCVDSQKCHFVASLFEGYRVRAIVTYNDLRAKEICEDLKLFGANPRFYPAKDLIFYQADIKGNAIVKERAAAIKEMLSGNPVTVVMSIDAALDKILPLEKVKESIVTLSDTDTIDAADLEKKLVALGYERQSMVSAPGEFAVRGGIIDIFPLNDENPSRIELFGDEVDSIRRFDVDSQRAVGNIERLTIFPAAEFILTDEELQEGFERIRAEEKKTESLLRKKMKNEEATRLKKVCEEAIETMEYSRGAASVDAFVTSFYDETASFLDYFGAEDLIVFDEPMRLEEKGEASLTEFRESMTGRLEGGYVLPSRADVIYDYKKILAKGQNKRLLLLSTLDMGNAGLKIKERFAVNAKNVNPYVSGIELLVRDLESYKKKRYKTIVVTGSSARGQRLAEGLAEYGITAVFSEDRERQIQEGETVIMYGALHKGFEYPLERLAVLAEGDTFGAARRKHKKRFSDNGNAIHSLHELSFGDFIVHERNGLGIYRGIEKLENDKTEQDYIKIEYADGELYIPATNLESIQKYASADADKKPRISRVNSNEWRKTKERVKKAVADIADQLVNLYAIRSSRPGFAFGKDTVWQREFEELFPYEETDDQLKAIEDTKNDMESSRIMDRLICGDVGYGKTEVALRAAFKAVQDGKQVVVLVPTTILAQQHYNTFSTRLVNYPVTVEMLSRFRTPAQQKATLTGLANGQVDIVIGTHRVLSKDVKFKELGLLIVDEEQRFGVTHKEKIKEMKKDVDVLTLTATPIPRTLHMSLAGIREMSVLEEPPVDRLPIQTFVMEHNDEIIREAVNREMARGGQVYYVSNRVNGIEEKAALVQRLCPDANVAFAHGQMSERELEKIMYAFISGEIDVLVATTIIETGLDISNVNTMIIDDADKMGLSQLYQLRGRVGRSSRTAYAFLMYKRGQVLKEIAEKRLQAIREFSDLGSGFKIAMRDLEIRGAGNVLGAEQSGHMEEVGYDLYCKLLDNAIRKAKGEEVVSDDFETMIKLPIDAFIPTDYIKNETQKLDMYKRIAMIETEEEKLDVIDELTDRYGDIPEVVYSLLDVAQIKAMCHSVYITAVTLLPSDQNTVKLRLSMYNEAPVKTELLDEFVNSHPESELKGSDKPFFTLTIKKGTKKMGLKEEQSLIFTKLKEFLGCMKELF